MKASASRPFSLRNILIIDTETGGSEPFPGGLLEVGAILYSVTHRSPLQYISTILPAPANPMEAVNRIPPAAVANMPEALANFGLAALVEISRYADAIAAHNAAFDQGWIASHTALDALHLKPWLCTATDLKWPRQTKPIQSLVELALNHGMGVGSAHRAISDCLLLAGLFDRIKSLEEFLLHGLRPKALYEALVSYDDRHLAKERGFLWKGKEEGWQGVIHCEDVAALPFDVELLKMIRGPVEVAV